MAIDLTNKAELFPIIKEKLSLDELNLLNEINGYYRKRKTKTNERDKEAKVSCYHNFSGKIRIFSQLISLILENQSWKNNKNFKASAGLRGDLVHFLFLNSDLESLKTEEMAAIILKDKYDAKGALTNNIQQLNISKEARKYILGLLEGNWSKIELIAGQWGELEKQDIFSQWAQGEINYPKSIFSSREEVELAGRLAEVGLATIIRDNKFTGMIERIRKKAEKLSAKGANEFIKRICAYEELFWKEEAEQKARKALRTQREEEKRHADAQQERIDKLNRMRQEARDRSEATQRKEQEFYSTVQPYALSEQAALMLEQLEAGDGLTANKRNHAKWLIKAIRDAQSILDIRGNNVKEFGDLLLSPANIAAAAKAFNVGNIFDDKTTPVRGSNATAERLVKLSHTSSAITQAIGTLMDQSDGIILLAPLVRDAQRCKDYAMHYIQAHSVPAGKKESGLDVLHSSESNYRNATATNVSLANAHYQLQEEIAQALHGRNIKKIVSKAAGVTVQKAAFELPQGWVETLGEEFFAEPSAQEERYVRISSNEFPYKAIELKRNILPDMLGEALTAFRIDCSMHRENVALLAELGSACGFTLLDSDSKIQLKHKEYKDIQVILEGTEADQTVTLLDAKAQFDERYFQQQSLLQMAKDAGIVVHGNDDNAHATRSVTLSHKVFGKVSLAESGYFSADDFITLENLIEQVHSKLPDTLLSESKVAVREKNTGGDIISGKKIIILDSTTLDRLAAEYGNNSQKWLDIIKCTASLSGVKVVIPSVVAEWELQGGIPVISKQTGKATVDAIDDNFNDPAYHLSKIANNVREFLKTASRAKLNDDGSVQFAPGADENIIIWETRDDKLLYDRITDIARTSTNGARKQRLQNEIYHRDEGEKAIERVVSEIPNAESFVIISDDKKHFTQSPLFTTPQTKPIGLASTASYLQAEIHLREPTIRQRLKCDALLSIYSISQSINEYWKKQGHKHKSGDKYLTPYTEKDITPNIDADKPPLINQLIYAALEKEAVRLEADASPTNAAEKANGARTVWAATNQLNKLEASPINPQQIHDRVGGESRLGG